MRGGFVAFSALTFVGLALTGCGFFRYEQREPWRIQAEQACLSQKLVTASAYMSRSSKIDGPGACGIEYPFKVAAFSEGSVALSQKATLACPIIASIERWLEEVVKPAALIYFRDPVVDIRAGSYACRPRNNQRGAKYSEHAFGNAFDVMGFALASGREISVVKGWRGASAEQDFLREVFTGACQYFTTVLAPGSDQYHYDHIHIDLARHDPRGERQICKPRIQFASRLTNANIQMAKKTFKEFEVADIDLERDMPVDAPLHSRQSPRGEAPARPGPAGPQPSPSASFGRLAVAPPPAQGPVYAAAPAYRPQPPGLPPLALPSDPYRPLGPVPRSPQALNAHGIY